MKLLRYLLGLKGRSLFSLSLGLISVISIISPVLSAPNRNPDREETCDILVAGGGLAGAATAYEGLLAGRTVCLTEITDWVGGQISSQGTSALDERDTQRSLLFYPRGYLELRRRIKEHYGRLNPGGCWVSYSCFMPYNGHKILFEVLQDAAKTGNGKLKWFPNTVIKELAITPAVAGNAMSGQQIKSAIAISHKPAANTPPINTETLSTTIEDSYRYENSARFNKTIIRFIPKPPQTPPNPPLQRGGNSTSSPPLQGGARGGVDWYVVDATETGELIGLADVPYRLGIDPRSPLEPSSGSPTGDAYCTQGFTYTFAMEATKEPQQHQLPSFYQQYAPYYSYELQRLASFPLVFSYRQIRSMKPDEPRPADPKLFPIYPGDISMQNWTWGNDYRPGSSQDNLIYSRAQLEANGQLQPGGWMGGLRTETLRRGEENSKGFFYWLVAGTTDSQLGNGVKKPYPNNRFLTGLNSPMGTVHGLSKYPYMREGRRIIGRPSLSQPEGFTVWEVDMSRANFQDSFYRQNLSEQEYRNLWLAVGGLNAPALAVGSQSVENTKSRSRATIYPDAVGIGHYAIDFHPCMKNSPPEAPGNIEREGTRKGQGQAYPFQIPLRAMIPQKIDNMLVAGKSIAVSHTAAAAYRVHSFEWSAGAAAGITAAFSLENGIIPYELVDELPSREPNLEVLQLRLQQNSNPIAFPGTSIFNSSWQNWK
ncbi:FAD-dependent oxidoreductase [Tychonema sp. BBK16]|uniref:FAD-dependent oxidoreductase n=1 Tax=Tychonema sp. BBK16 TaxID=2699888 RepID=UPI001F476460|nr:FAD-dependent oxidoreductase [Tychonema sp. BBK16]MCF6375885.1 FAD-dependent oxidoreductase [Tychonema sp. BBK16]